jgi:hypothetical protein
VNASPEPRAGSSSPVPLPRPPARRAAGAGFEVTTAPGDLDEEGVITPHSAFHSTQTMARMAEMVVENTFDLTRVRCRGRVDRSGDRSFIRECGAGEERSLDSAVFCGGAEVRPSKAVPFQLLGSAGSQPPRPARCSTRAAMFHASSSPR